MNFVYLRAADWGMRWERKPVAEKQLDPECFIHHSAGSHHEDAATAFRALNEYAIKSKGYSALDYDVLVHRNSKSGVVTIGEGRGPWMSAATHDRNEQGEAVCVLGYFHPGSTLSREPHPDEIEGTARAIVWAVENGWIASDAEILGHRDNPAHRGATACPGNYLYAHLPAIRKRVVELQVPVYHDEETGMLINNRILADTDSAPPVSAMNVDPADASTSRWFIAAVLAGMFKQLTGSKLYTQPAAEKLNELLRD